MATAAIVRENISLANHLHYALPNTIVNVKLNYFSLLLLWPPTYSHHVYLVFAPILHKLAVCQFR